MLVDQEVGRTILAEVGKCADGQRAAGTVHGAGELAVPRGRGRDGAGDVVLVGDVGGLEADGARSPGRGDLVDGGLQRGLGAADDERVAAGGHDALGDGLTDAAATAGDQHRPICQPTLD